MTQGVENVRRIWTPREEVEEITARMEPGSELDSIIRDYLHRVVQQRGPFTLDLDTLNVGKLRMEITGFEPVPGRISGSQVALWVEL